MTEREPLTEYEKDILANAPLTDLWRVLKKVIGYDLERLQLDMREFPKFSDDDLREDLRHKMGGADRLQWVLDLPKHGTELD